MIVEDVAVLPALASFAPHCAAKAAQAMLTRCSRGRSLPRCGCAASRPGRSRSSPGQEERRAAETLLGRVGSPEDVAEAVSYLAGADFVTGTTLVVDGGPLAAIRPGAIP